MSLCATCGKQIEGGFKGYQDHLNHSHTKRTMGGMFQEVRLVPHRFTKRSRKEIVAEAEKTWLKEHLIQ
jgi:DNA-directed RNA polymerase subunit N (RpoN/RPB10)